MRELVQLAKTFDDKKHKYAGRFLSEKMDGSRAIWFPNSRGMRVGDVPFSNLTKNADKKKDRIATGLWSRYGNVINCPDWWCEDLPDIALDGELYLGRGAFQSLRSIVSHKTPNEPAWKTVAYRIFDAPNDSFWRMDRINNPNFKREITGSIPGRFIRGSTFAEVYDNLQELEYGNYCRVHQQVQLPMEERYASFAVQQRFRSILADRGEGVMLRCPVALWEPKRTVGVLKQKALHDAEGVIAGFVFGKGKHEGRMGSLRIAWKGVEFNIHGFTDEERELMPGSQMWEPGTLAPFSTKHFPINTEVTFNYRELSDDGIPKEATYQRKYQPL